MQTAEFGFLRRVGALIVPQAIPPVRPGNRAHHAANTAARITDKIAQYAAAPTSLANQVTALQGRTGIRLRVGDWRVIMDDDGIVLTVLQIGPRGGVYQ